ncbi:MAG: response regulator [Cyanobacteria bacterium P01_D01_bin.73]
MNVSSGLPSGSVRHSRQGPMEIQCRNGLSTEIYRVLVIEHNDPNFYQVNELFEKTSFSVPAAGADATPRLFKIHREECIAGAIAELKDEKYLYDAVLFDWRTPDNTCGSAVADLVYQAGNAPVLLLTGFGDDPEEIRHCLRHGVMEHLGIPRLAREGPKVLVNAILDAIAEREGVEASENIRFSALISELARVGRTRKFFLTIAIFFVAMFGQPSMISDAFKWKPSAEARLILMSTAFAAIWKKKPEDKAREILSKARRNSRKKP